MGTYSLSLAGVGSTKKFAVEFKVMLPPVGVPSWRPLPPGSGPPVDVKFDAKPSRPLSRLLRDTLTLNDSFETILASQRTAASSTTAWSAGGTAR